MALANIRKIKSLFTPDCQIVVGAPIPEIQGHDMLISTIYQARRIVNRIDIDFYDISVTIGDNHVRARTIMTAAATGLAPQEGERVIEAREIEMRWKKVEGLWKIREVRLIQTLR